MGRAATFNAATELALPLRALCAPPQLSLCTHHSFCFTQKVGSCASMDAHEISRNLKSLKNDDRTLKRWLSSTNASLFLHSRALSSPNVEFLRLRPQYQVFTESKSCLGSRARVFVCTFWRSWSNGNFSRVPERDAWHNSRVKCAMELGQFIFSYFHVFPLSVLHRGCRGAFRRGLSDVIWQT